MKETVQFGALVKIARRGYRLNGRVGVVVSTETNFGGRRVQVLPLVIDHLGMRPDPSGSVVTLNPETDLVPFDAVDESVVIGDSMAAPR